MAIMKLALSIFKFFHWIKMKSTHIKDVLLNLPLQTEHSPMISAQIKNQNSVSSLDLPSNLHASPTQPKSLS